MFFLIRSLVERSYPHVWRPSGDEALVGRTRQYMTLIYSLSLSIIAVVSIGIHVMLDRVIEVQNRMDEVINLSGQQRMLSQRSSSFALEYLYTRDEKTKQAALAALEKLQTNHRYLLAEHEQALAEGNPSPLSPALQKLYFQPPMPVDTLIQRYAQELHTVLQSPPWVQEVHPEQLAFLTLARGDLLQTLHQVVAQYEQESHEHIEHLRQIQRVLLIVVISTLMLEAWYIFRPMVDKISGLTDQLHREATQDALSGLLNRRAFYEELNQAIAHYPTEKRAFSLLLIDLDYFKQINDQYGHIAGDRVIQALGQLLNTSHRATDRCARVGGEEFAVLLTGCSAADAYQKAERIRQQVQALVIEVMGQRVLVQCSGGVAEFQPDMSAELLYSAVDEALYRAKREGRNRICTAV